MARVGTLGGACGDTGRSPPAGNSQVAGWGLRLGEVLGLEVDDVDFGRGELSVRRQLKM